MVDVFISHAREDKERVEPIIAALRQRGFSAWWYYDLNPTESREITTERKLDEALAAIIVWSRNSYENKAVLSESRRAGKREISLHIYIDDVEPKLFHDDTEWIDMRGWDGASDTESWRRIVDHVRSLTNAARSRQPQERSSALATSAGFTVGARNSDKQAQETVRPVSYRSNWLRIVFSMMLAGLMATVASVGATLLLIKYHIGDPADWATIGGLIGVGALYWWLFASGGDNLPPHKRSLVGHWLKPVSDGPRVRSAEAFHLLFQSVFGATHFSFKTLWRAALVSLYFVLIFTTIISVVYTSVGAADDSTKVCSNLFARAIDAIMRVENCRTVHRYQVKNAIDAITGLAWLPVVIVTLKLSWINVLVDYVSLFETRLFLRFLRRRPNWSLPVVSIDIFLTSLIAFTAFVIFMIWPPLEGLKEDVLNKLNPSSSDILSSPATIIVMFAMAATTAMTSIWLILGLIFGPVTRALFWTNMGKPKLLGRLFGIEKRPFRALAIVASSPFWIALVIYVGVGYVVS